jgi:hypothetical protein
MSARRHGQQWPDDLPDDLRDALAVDTAQTTSTAALYDVDRIEAILHAAARQGAAMSYSELLADLGFRFTRPKMRTVCKTLDAVDRRAAERGEPELAVLVVRETDRLPGQGWWVGRTDYAGAWEGKAAVEHIALLQARAFAYWRNQ